MDLFQFADRYPNAPGYRQTDTSKAAAKSVDAAKLRSYVLEAMKVGSACGGFTADECAAWLVRDKLSIRPRFTELKLEGLIEDTGERRRNESGRKAIVWRLSIKH